MGCSCKTAQQVSYLNRKYGDHVPVSKASHIRDSVGVFLKESALLLLIIPFVPFMAITAAFSRRPIDIGKFMKKKAKNEIKCLN